MSDESGFETHLQSRSDGSFRTSFPASLQALRFRGLGLGFVSDAGFKASELALLGGFPGPVWRTCAAVGGRSDGARAAANCSRECRTMRQRMLHSLRRIYPRRPAYVDARLTDLHILPFVVQLLHIRSVGGSCPGEPLTHRLAGRIRCGNAGGSTSQ